MIAFEIPGGYGATIGVVAHPPIGKQENWTCDISIDGELLGLGISCEHNALWKILRAVPVHRGQAILDILGRIQETGRP